MNWAGLSVVLGLLVMAALAFPYSLALIPLAWLVFRK